jgi:endoglucanase
MKTRLSILICFLLLSQIVFSQVIQTPNGFKLRSGINLALWLSQSEKRGAEREQYITETDIAKIASLGFDHVRLPIDEEQMWDEKGAKHPEAFKLMHNAIAWSAKHNLRVIVDLHIIRSHYFNAKSNALWTNPAEQEKLVALWKQLSDELKDYPVAQVAYELMNEAVADNDNDWNQLVAKLIKSIRSTEPNRTIVVGSNKWQGTETFPALRVPDGDSNLILSFHYYRPFGFTHYKTSWSELKNYSGPVHYPGEVVTKDEEKANAPGYFKNLQWAIGYWDRQRIADEIEVAARVAKKYKLPLYCGEFGVYPTSSKEDAMKWYSDLISIFKEKGIAFAHWEYKGEFIIVDKNLQPVQPLVDILVK